MADAEHLLAEYRRSREQLAAVHRALARLTVSESSHDGAVTVTVGANGRLVELDVHDETYRHYRPQRLAETVVALSEKAAKRAVAEAARLLEPVLPPGADAVALLDGTADLRPDETTPDDGRGGHGGHAAHDQGHDGYGAYDQGHSHHDGGHADRPAHGDRGGYGRGRAAYDDDEPDGELQWIETAHGGRR